MSDLTKNIEELFNKYEETTYIKSCNINDVAKFSLIKKVYDKIKEKVDKSETKPNFFIAGGVFQSLLSDQRVNDIDIFTSNPSDLISILGKPDYQNDMVANFVIDNFPKIQVIKKYTANNPKEIIDMFDFSIVSCVYDGNKIEYHKRFFIDISQKMLVITNLPKPLSTFDRVVKYVKRGYNICPQNRLKLVQAINILNIDFDNPDENHIMFYSDGTTKFNGID
jgi:hypothetical protein